MQTHRHQANHRPCINSDADTDERFAERLRFWTWHMWHLHSELSRQGGCLASPLPQSIASTYLNTRDLGNICIFGYEEERSKIAAALKLLAFAAHE